MVRLLVLLVVILVGSDVFAQLPGYDYRKKFSVDNTLVSGSTDLTNFPVLISITNADFATIANSGYVNSSNGFDIAFTSDDGSTQLDHELESYNATTGEILFWVRFPSLSASLDTDFFIYYGNASQTTDQSTTATWNSNYQLVMHMDDLTDATSNGNDGTNNGTTSTTGKLGNARSFSSGSNDFISVADDATLDITQNLTISAWVNADNFGDVPDLITKGDWNQSYATWIRNTGTLRFADDGTDIVTSTSTISSGVTAYVTFTSNGSGSEVYINGVQDNTGTAPNYSTNNNPLYLSTNAYPLNGWLDEVRVMNTPMTEDWIATEYNNQNSPGTFYSQITDSPLLADIEETFQQVFSSGAAVFVTSTLTINHPSLTTLSSATIEVSSNYDSGFDQLDFTDQLGITGSWNSGTGVLTLSGTTTFANYQTAIRSITFETTSSDQNTRTISITGNDGSDDTNTKTRDINIITTLTDLSSDITTTQIVFHYDAQDIDGDLDTGDQPADGTLVTSWGDRSVNVPGVTTNNITTSTSVGDAPTFDSYYFGERGGLFFDYNSGNNGDNLPMSDDATVNQSNFTEKSFATVFRTGDDVSGLQIIYEQGSRFDGYQISIKDGNLYAFVWTNNSGGFTESINLGAVSTNESYIVIANHNNTVWEAMANGGAISQSSGTAGTVGSSGGDPNIGEEDGTNDPVELDFNNPGTTNNFNGYIAELVSWNVALTSGEIASIHNYLCEKWCNEAPVLSAIEGTNLDYTEGDSPTAITSSVTISDADNTLLESARIYISTGFVLGEDELAFSNTASITGSWNASSGVLTLSGITTLANYQTALQSITYENLDALGPTGGLRQIDFVVYDWDDSSNVQSRNVNVISINSTPSLSGITGSAIAYTEGDGQINLSAAVTITDVDDPNIESATISITSNYFIGEDILDFTNTGSISASFEALTGILTLTGSATVAEYETALENVSYENTSSDPIELTRTISFTVNDGDTDSNTESRDVSIAAANSAPVLSNIETSPLAYPDNAVEITHTIEVTDPDDTSIDSAVVLISANFQAAEDSLIYSTLYGISGTYDETTGKLLLSGNSSFSDYQTVLRSVKYKNYGAVATGSEREISFLAYDDEAAESDTAKRYIAVNPVESISGLTVWLRADVGVTTSGSEVTTWADQSGNSNDFVGVADAATRPTYVASSASLGDQPAIEFAGDGDHFLDTDGENYLNGLTEFTLFLVYKSDQTNTDRGLWISQQPSGADETLTIRYDASGANGGDSYTNVVKTGILANSTANQLESFSDIQTTNPQIMSLHWESGTAFDIYVDGILNNPSYAGSPPTGTMSGSDRAIVGKGGKDDPSVANQSWDGLIAEVILYGKNLSDEERESVEDYLSEKYNSAIRKITPATGGEAISADDANTTYTALTGPIIQEGFAGEFSNSGTIILTAPSGYEWNTGTSPSVTVSAAYGGSTALTASFTSIDTDEITYTITTASTSNPGQIEFSGLEVRPTTGILPNTGNITNSGTTGQGGGTNYGTLTMIPGVVDSLEFTQQPSATSVDSTISPSVRVQLVDQFGNTVESSGVNVAIAKATGPGVLSATSPVATNILGVADFPDITLDQVGEYTLEATSAGLDADTSNTFNVVNTGTITGFVIKRYPTGNISSKYAGQEFAIVITAVDGTGTTITSFTGTVTISSSCSMGTGQGTTASFTSGVLASHTVSVTSIGTCTLTATRSSGSEFGVSNSFTVTPGPADVTQSTISASPTIIVNDGSSTSAITVQLKDTYGNDLISGGKTVILSTTAGSLGSVTDNADGTFSATLTSSTSIETATITGTYGGDSITDDADVDFAAFSHIWISQLGSPSAATDWYDTDNWNVPSVPGVASVVLIPAEPSVGNEFPVVDASTTITELALETGAELTVSGTSNFEVTSNISGDGDIFGSNNDSLTVGGDLNVSNVTVGQVVFNGASNQTIDSPHSYLHATIDNPTTVQATANLTISGTLTLTDGELLIPSGLNLISTSQSYGAGELRFQRKVSGAKGWRMITSPVSSTYGDFLDGTLTQGYSGAFYSTGSNPGDTLQPNVLTYIESYPGTDNQRYRTPSSAATSLTEGQGMWVYFFGEISGDSRYTDPLPDTLDVNGQEFSGNGTEVDFGITYTTTADSGWNFVGNPFGAAINWGDSPNWTKTNVESTIYIWDPSANSGNGEYLTWNGTTGTLGSGLIAPFQGFWVKANASSPSLKVKLAGKTTGANFIRKIAPSSSPVIELEAVSGTLSKRTNIMFSQEGTREKDDQDGLRLIPFSSTHIEFYSRLSDGTQLAINNQPLGFKNRVNIPLVVNGYVDGQAVSEDYQIKLNSFRNLPDSWQVFLIDNQTGEATDLLALQAYNFSHATSAKIVSNSSPTASNYTFKTKATTSSARFTLRITTEEIEANIPETLYLNQNYPNPFNPSTTITYGLQEASTVRLEIYDILGRKIQTLVNAEQFAGNYSAVFNAGALASGTYIYRLTTHAGVYSKRLMLIK